MKRRITIIQQSLEIIQNTKKLETALGRIELSIENLLILADYEKQGIRVVENSQPQKIIAMLVTERDRKINDFIYSDYTNAVMKSQMATTLSGRLDPFSKLIVVINELRGKLSDTTRVDDLSGTIMKEYRKIKLNSFLEDAEKAEMKGKKDKALDCYYEAYYYLTHDMVNDNLQRDDIEKIKARILDFGGEII